ncbi:hypothetical protein [Citrobacter meridianamericanus]|uniref:Uncharacterized protein n=1 Tax=Citrobacter meridianamericanus TaxID=2894201 RepID=A0ABT1BF78_9ENTR|nr:hypothetical protein [Citrobacter meridianamericanus]MCO5784525.1 hypothetical protein [Citrobacter meridianamericanus]
MYRALLLTPFLLANLLLPCQTYAQDIPEGTYNLWLAEQPISGVRLFKARIAGSAHYGKFDTHATLALVCGTGGSKSGVQAELAVDVRPLAFDTDPYEGPGATTSGPVNITVGVRPPPDKPSISRPVAGFFSDGGPFDTGMPFIFSFRDLPMKQWVAPAMRGQMLTFTLPSAKPGSPLTFRFLWPEDDTVLKRVVTPCL